MNQIDLATITHLDVEADVRYWEDGTINGVEDEDGTLVPGRRGDTWAIRVDIAEGRIESWPEGTVAQLHYKVADAGDYWLSDRTGRRLFKYRPCSVPTSFLSQGATGHSDYIIMDVGPDGRIENYRVPSIDEERWVPVSP